MMRRNQRLIALTSDYVNDVSVFSAWIALCEQPKTLKLREYMDMDYNEKDCTELKDMQIEGDNGEAKPLMVL